MYEMILQLFLDKGRDGDASVDDPSNGQNNDPSPRERPPLPDITLVHKSHQVSFPLWNGVLQVMEDSNLKYITKWLNFTMFSLTINPTPLFVLKYLREKKTYI